MHRSLARVGFSLSVATTLVLSVAGCEDSAARQRDEVRAQLSEIREELRSTMSKGGESYQADLDRIVSRLASVSGGEPGQQAAKSFLAANALRELAMTHVHQAADIESEHRAQLAVANSRIAAAMRLQALASGMDSVGADQRRTQLQESLQTAMDGVNAAQQKLAELESPIADRTSQNDQQKAEIERLRVQVGDLMRQAQAAGYSAGFETFKQATALSRQADRIEFEVSNREIDLEHDLTPQRKMAESQKVQLEALASSIEAAQSELDAFSAAARGDAQTSRAKASELSTQVSEQLSSVQSAADGPLKAAYDEALAAIERATTNARSAGTGSGPDSAAAKTTAARLHELAARVHISAANGLADRINTLQRVKASNGAIKVDGIDSRISDLSSRQQEHLSEARAAITEAIDAADSVGGNSSEVAAMRANLQLLSDALNNAQSGDATPVESAPVTPEAPAEPTEPSDNPAAPAIPEDVASDTPGSTTPTPAPDGEPAPANEPDPMDESPKD